MGKIIRVNNLGVKQHLIYAMKCHEMRDKNRSVAGNNWKIIFGCNNFYIQLNLIDTCKAHEVVY